MERNLAHSSLKASVVEDSAWKIAVIAKHKIWKRKQTKTPITISVVYFLRNPLVYSKISRTTTIHPGIFGGLAQWADSALPQMNTIASRDQFKPIRIGENLVVNYSPQCSSVENAWMDSTRPWKFFCKQGGLLYWAGCFLFQILHFVFTASI